MEHDWIEIPKINGDQKLRGSTNDNIYIEQTPHIKDDWAKSLFTISSVRRCKTHDLLCNLAKDITDKVIILDDNKNRIH